MALPTYEEVMLPVLDILAASGPRHRRELVLEVADRLQLSEAERQQTLPSGKATVIMSRVGWALAYLKQARRGGVGPGRAGGGPGSRLWPTPGRLGGGLAGSCEKRPARILRAARDRSAREDGIWRKPNGGCTSGRTFR